MSPRINDEPRDESVSISDRATSPPPVMRGADRPPPREINTEGLTKSTMMEEENLAPLFTESVATDFRARWDAVQKGFVDDPQAAVRAGDELVARVIKSLAETFASQRSEFAGDGELVEEPTTENLRLSLRRYRSFFERLLSI
jgi:hypothetical protein